MRKKSLQGKKQGSGTPSGAYTNSRLVEAPMGVLEPPAVLVLITNPTLVEAPGGVGAGGLGGYPVAGEHCGSVFFALVSVFSATQIFDSVSKSHRHKRAISRWVKRLPYKCKAFWGVKCDLWIGVVFSQISPSMGHILGVKNPPGSHDSIVHRFGRRSPTMLRKAT